MKTKKMKTSDRTVTRYWERIPGFNYALGFADRIYPNTSPSGLEEVCISRYIPDFNE